MKRRFVIINFGLAIAVLFAILFQSVDSFGHLKQQFSEKQCHHQHHSASEITHQHHNFDHCLVCEFTFAGFISPKIYACDRYAAPLATLHSFTTVATPPRFSGSSFLLRGPPVFIA